jgi:hypothetical protein
LFVVEGQGDGHICGLNLPQVFGQQDVGKYGTRNERELAAPVTLYSMSSKQYVVATQTEVPGAS